MKKVLSAFITFVLIAISAQALASADEQRRLSSQLLAQSGLDDLLTHYPELVKSGIRHNIRRAGMPDKVASMFDRAVDDAFDQEQISHQVLSRIEENMSSDEMEAVLSWYGSPLGRKVTRAELTEVSGNEYASLQTELDRLTEEFEGSERARLFPAFDRATRATESMLDNALSIELAMAASLTAIVSGPDLPEFADLKQIITRKRMMLRGQVGQQVYSNYLYTYRNLSLEELESYIDFARTENGRRFVEVVNTAVFSVLEERSELLGQGRAVATLGDAS